MLSEPRHPTLPANPDSEPLSVGSLLRLGAAQTARGDHAAADEMLERALRLDPTHAGAALQYTMSAQRRRDWPEVHRRWRAMAVHQPLNVDVAIGLADALRELDRFDEAEAHLKDALVEFCCDSKLLAPLARLAMARRNLDRAITCWGRFLEVYPQAGQGYQGLGHALMDAGRHDEAEAALRRATELNPADVWARILLARLQTLMGDWDSAFAGWLDLKEKQPNNTAAQGVFKEVMRVLRMARADGVASLAPPPAAALLASQPEEVFAAWERQLERGWFKSQDEKLLLGFESLGGSCEFGLVQRRFWAEPLGLLRWAEIPVKKLAAALRANLAGFGDAENTELDLYEGKEYAVIDSRYEMRSHTTVMVDDAPRDAVFVQQCRRLRFLRDRLLEDLQEASKILVYGTRVRLADSDIEDLYAAVRSYGPNRLLCVRPEEPGHPNGEVQRVRDGLFVAYIDKPWQGGRAPLAPESWLQICRRTYDISNRPLGKSAEALITA